MLVDFENKIKNLRVFDFGQELQAIVEDNTEKLADYDREQLATGKDGNNEPNQIFDRDEYRPLTVEIKKREGVGLGAVTDRITNYMTGDFYNSLVMDVEGNTLEADSPVPYFGDIRLYSSDSLLEINEKNRRDFAENVVMPRTKEDFERVTGFKITTRG